MRRPESGRRSRRSTSRPCTSSPPTPGSLYVGASNCGSASTPRCSKVAGRPPREHRLEQLRLPGRAADRRRAGRVQPGSLQAAAEGIGALLLAAVTPATTRARATPAGRGWTPPRPWVTAVGGTTTRASRRHKSVAFQTGWGTDLVSIVSNDGVLGYDQALPGRSTAAPAAVARPTGRSPSYQYGVVPSAVAQGLRAAPDIAADADPFDRSAHRRPRAGVGLHHRHRRATYERDRTAARRSRPRSFAAQTALVQQACGTDVGFAEPDCSTRWRSGITDASFPDVQLARAVVVAYARPRPAGLVSARDRRPRLVAPDRDRATTT